MPLFIAGLIIQAACFIHAWRTGADRFWFGVILFLPLLGCALYMFLVVLPELQRSRAARRVGDGVQQRLDPQRDLRRRLDDLEDTRTVANRIAAAEELSRLGQHDAAMALYEESLTGLYAQDPQLLLGLAKAQTEAGQPGACIATLERLREHNPAFQSADGHLLYARALADAGEVRRADEEFRAVLAYYAGAEAPVRYGLFLADRGRDADAREQFDRVLREARRNRSYAGELNRPWIRMAREYGS